MRKVILIGLMVLATFLLAACDGIDLSQISDEDIGRIAGQAIVCNPPYMRLGTGCCLDMDNNSICDQDEKGSQALPEEFKPEDIYNDKYDDYDKLGDLSTGSEMELKAKKMIKEGESRLAESFEHIMKAKADGAEIFDSESFYFEAKGKFQEALKLYDEGKYEESALKAAEAVNLALKAKEIAKSGKPEWEKVEGEYELGEVELKAEVTNDGIVLKWSKYDGDGFDGYKVVRSYEAKNPKYPEDGYLKYITNIDEISYVDSETLKDDAYYAITVLTKHGKVYSNTIKVEIVEESEDDSEDNTEMEDDDESDDSSEESDDNSETNSTESNNEVES